MRYIGLECGLCLHRRRIMIDAQPVFKTLIANSRGFLFSNADFYAQAIVCYGLLISPHCINRLSYLRPLGAMLLTNYLCIRFNTNQSFMLCRLFIPVSSRAHNVNCCVTYLGLQIYPYSSCVEAVSLSSLEWL